MAIGIVSESDFDNELGENDSASARIEELKIGRGNKNATPKSLRNVISETAITEGNPAAKELVKSIGGEISQSSISAYKNSSTSTASYHEPNPGLEDHNEQTHREIAAKARDRLVAAMESITPDKLEAAKVRDASGVAKDMSSIIKDMEPSVEKDVERVQFVLLVPPLRQEESFEVIDVKE